jgi:hypothetical protein
MTLRATLALVLGALLATAPAVAQTTVIDEGSFRIAIRGSAIGTETFTIRRSGRSANATTVAQSRIVLDTGEQTRTVVQLRGSPLAATAYQIEATGDDRQSITGRASGSRVRATMVSDASERMREFLVDDAAVVLDGSIAHQHFFLADRTHDGTVPVILPRQSRQVSARVRDRGADTLEIAGQQVPARHLAIEIDGLDPRSVWVDDHNRVLRVHIPAQELTAQRTSLP